MDPLWFFFLNDLPSLYFVAGAYSYSLFFLVSFIIPKKKMMVEKVQETVLLSRLKKNK
jgi:hypothetical protein